MGRDVRKFLVIATALVTLNTATLVALLYASSAYVLRYPYGNWETESTLAIMPTRERVDVVFLGASHARTLSRARNHLRVEKALGQHVLNLSRGGGGGVVPMLVSLSLFFELGNSAGRIVYFIDPWALYSRSWNEDNAFYTGEPFSLRFARYVYRYAGARGLRDYAFEKLTPTWLATAPDVRVADTSVVPFRDETLVRKRIANLYNAGTDPAAFETYERVLEEVVVLAQRRSRLTFVLLPTLLGEEPGKAELLRLLERLRSTHGVPFFDFSDCITTPDLFADHDHLNSRGVAAFATGFLGPALSDRGVARVKGSRADSAAHEP